MSEFSHLRNKLLAEQVEDQIYHYILDTPIEPGAKLPNEFALGEKFRVGRSTIREAVKLLSSKGIVEVRQGSGTYVVTTVKGLSDPLNLRSVQDKNALAFDLVNVRLLLEPGIAEMAAQNATPEDIERLRRLCERVETKIHEGDRYIEDDIAFHTCIAESSKNLVVGQLIPVIDTAVMMFVNVTHKKLIDETIMTHRMITEAIAKIGEKIDIRRFTVYEYGNDTLGHYIHGAGRIGVLVELEGGDTEVAKDVAMHIAAANPSYLDRTQVPASELDHEKEVLAEQAKNEGKPEKIIEKMVMGRIQKFYKEICLVDQEFIKDPDKSISTLLKEHNAKAKRFVRFQLGEGIEKKKEDFAAEVASFVK